MAGELESVCLRQVSALYHVRLNRVARKKLLFYLIIEHLNIYVAFLPVCARGWSAIGRRDRIPIHSDF